METIIVRGSSRVFVTRGILDLVLENVYFTNVCDWTKKDREQNIHNIIWTH